MMQMREKGRGEDEQPCHVRYADIEQFVARREPDEPNIGHEELSKLALLVGEVPDAVHFLVDLFLRQQHELLVSYHGASEPTWDVKIWCQPHLPKHALDRHLRMIAQRSKMSIWLQGN
jgi:hypothetical protein